ncbi:MAG TPA: zf-HC2 domain-containing protein [Gemmatimonadales bacterium]|nr:zf-HC2 domain-containing protein [Gemmatimonadales bacterium]
MTQDSQEGGGTSMSHVDEGTLHAYLDGELSPPERAALDVHLAQCAPCGARLAEERSLIERASAVLGGARPSERPAPPLSELASPRRRGRRILGARLPFAWAATVVLALGIGYYLHAPESRVTPAQEPKAIATNVPAADKLEVPDLQRRSDVRSARSRKEVATADRARASDSTASAMTQPLPTGAAALQPRTQLRGAALVRAAAPVAPAPASLAERFAPSGSYTDRGIVRPPLSSQWIVISRGSARTLLGADPVGIPGLAARDIRRSPTDATIVVEQQLDSTTVIQLFQRAATVDGAALGFSQRFNAQAERAPAERLARYVGRLRVEIAGPLTPDSLNRLLEQVQPLP